MIVQSKPITDNYKAKIGHVVGLAVNAVDETVLLVKWANKVYHPESGPQPIHPDNCEKLQ